MSATSEKRRPQKPEPPRPPTAKYRKVELRLEARSSSLNLVDLAIRNYALARRADDELLLRASLRELASESLLASRSEPLVLVPSDFDRRQRVAINRDAAKHAA